MQTSVLPSVLSPEEREYREQLRHGTVENCGINHDLHYVNNIPERVMYRGIPLPLLHLDFIECELPAIGWVLLDENVCLMEQD